ncbi:MAG TPA: LTA synthase family protein [Fontimonas sp.]
MPIRHPASTIAKHPLFLLLQAGIVALLIWGAGRLVLSAQFPSRIAGDAGAVLGTGLRVDFITLGWMFSVPVLLLPLAAWPRTQGLWTRLSRLWLAGFILTALILELSSPSFVGEYELRPNHLALDYLGNLHEVSGMLWGAFRTSLIVGLTALAIGLYATLRWVCACVAPAPRRFGLLLMWPLAVALTTLLIRGTLDHRPANPALFARWSDSLVNQIALNSTYSIGYALYALRHESDVGEIYGKLPEAELRAWLREDPRFVNSPDTLPTLHRLQPTRQRAQPLNLVLVVEESLGADFSGRLGGRGLTPNLDRWADAGIWFESLYATGTRSARGLEAIVSGFPPSPAQPVLKRDRAQTNFTTLASVLRDAGYRTGFTYGGGSHFDNMRGFFLGNGFDTVFDEHDYVDPKFRGSWGVSDEDLFDQTLKQVGTMHAAGQPFFQLVFTSSNHTPFEFPRGRLAPEHDLPGTLEGAVRYADHAVGAFLDAAREQPWFGSTVVMVVADHDIRVYGDDVVPLPRFRIPGLIVGADMPAVKINSLASQIDLAPTLLSLMGVGVDVPFPGYDLTAMLPEFGVTGGRPPRALMQFDNRFAWLEGDRLSVLHPGGRAETWQVDPADLSLHAAAPADSPVRSKLLGKVSLPGWLYDHGGYRVPRVELAHPGQHRPTTSPSLQRTMMPLTKPRHDPRAGHGADHAAVAD